MNTMNTKTKPTNIWWVTTYNGNDMLSRRIQGERLVRKLIGDNARKLSKERTLSTVITTTFIDGWMVAASIDVKSPTLEDWPSAIKDF